jgi:hypothetical protein
VIRRRQKPQGPRIDYSVLPIKKGPSIQLEKGWKSAALEAALEKAYRAVDQRDENRSRVTGTVLLPSTGNDKRRREHNHLGPRSTYPSLKTAVKNIFLVSAYEHGFITRNELLIHGRDANKDLRFSWNRRLVPVGKEPFRIPASVRWQPNARVAA